MSGAAKYFWIALTSARSNLAYKGELIGRVIFLMIVLYIFLRLWLVTYTQTGAKELGGLELAQMLWYLSCAEAIILSTPRLAQEIDEDVRTGGIAVWLVRPLSYPFYRLAVFLGERSVRFAMNAVVASGVALLLVGPIQLSWQSFVFAPVAIALAFLVDFVGYCLIGLAAFWLEDTSGITLIYSRLTMILGGMLIPLELFPDAVRRVCEFLPFASVIWGPSRLFVRPDAAAFVSVLLHQIGAICVLGIALTLVWRACLRRVSAQGG